MWMRCTVPAKQFGLYACCAEVEVWEGLLLIFTCACESSLSADVDGKEMQK
jgi:hypothetical protein